MMTMHPVSSWSAANHPALEGPGRHDLPDLQVGFASGLTVQVQRAGHECQVSDFGLPDPSTGLPTIQADADGPGFSVFPGFEWSPPLPHTNSVFPETAPEWNVLPPHIPAGQSRTELDTMVARVCSSASSDSQEVSDEFNQPSFPSISSLLNPSNPDNAAHPVSAAVGEHVSRTPIACPIARIAYMYTLSHLVRWYVSRTKRSYEQMPNFMRPTRLQRTKPHPPWVDAVVWPDCRDMILNEDHWDHEKFNLFREGISESLSVNWPYQDTIPVIPSRSNPQIFELDPAFESHIRNGNNWTVGPGLARRIPSMAPICTPTPA